MTRSIRTAGPHYGYFALVARAGIGETVRVRNRALVIVGFVAVLLGGVWALQGGGVLGGSAMSGSTMWLVIGVAVVVVGALMITMGVRARR